MTMTVNLGDALERSVEELVANGRYGSRSEVLREGVRLVEEREQQLEKLRRELDPAVAEMKAGRLSDADGIFDRLEARYLGAAKDQERTAAERA